MGEKKVPENDPQKWGNGQKFWLANWEQKTVIMKKREENSKSRDQQSVGNKACGRMKELTLGFCRQFLGI